MTCVQGNARADQSRLYYLGFLGEARQLKKEPGEPMSGSFSLFPHSPRALLTASPLRSRS